MTTTKTDPNQVLKEIWGYDSFRPLQAESIQCVLSQHHSLTVMPTGGGKSICFQVPALCLDGLAVVVSPLISLMKDQVDALTASGVPAAFVNSSQSAAQQRLVAGEIEAQRLKLLYLAPERLLMPSMLSFLDKAKVTFFAIDEAHCISAWGHDFRPEYRGLKVLKERFPGTSIHAFTATASEAVRRDIAAQLGVPDATMLVGSFDRPNLVYRILNAENRLQQVLDVVTRHPGDAGIVYCISRKEVDKTAQFLCASGYRALAYHAGLDDQSRQENQEAFINEKCDVIVATVAFGMGIDKSNVRFVVHAGMPKSIENYQQESGRAGRDGLQSECVLIYSPADLVTWKRIMGGGDASANQLAFASLDAIAGFCGNVVCRHRALVEYFGQSYTSPDCQACDICLDEVTLVDDAITLSQKIISCVARLEQKFGVLHTAKVLTGSREQRILELGHEKLSTYGLLAQEAVSTVRQWIEQLVQQGFLQRSGEYQILTITPAGRQLLKRDGAPKLSAPSESSKRKSATVVVENWDGVDRGLFDELRGLRRSLASERNLPAYIVFGDSTLRELARIRPSTMAGFGKIKGVGEKKREDFGQVFVEKIQAYTQQHDLPCDIADSALGQRSENQQEERPRDSGHKRGLNSSSLAAFPYFRNGESIEAVAKKMGRAHSTVSGYLAQYLESEKVTDASLWVDVETSGKILQQLHLLEDNRMKPIYEHFGGEISYDTIRITLQCWRNRQEIEEP